MDRSYLMNLPLDYDNDMEILKTHPDLFPEADRILANSQRMRTPVHHRSVLGETAITDSQSAGSRLADSRFSLCRAANPNPNPNPNSNTNPGTQRSWRNVVANRQLSQIPNRKIPYSRYAKQACRPQLQ